MENVKRTYREGEQATKETWRKADGTESVADTVGSIGDEIRKDLGNAGDDLRRGQQREVDEAKAAWRRSDGDESPADKAGNAGDTVRRELGQP